MLDEWVTVNGGLDRWRERRGGKGGRTGGLAPALDRFATNLLAKGTEIKQRWEAREENAAKSGQRGQHRTSERWCGRFWPPLLNAEG